MLSLVGDTPVLLVFCVHQLQISHCVINPVGKHKELNASEVSLLFLRVNVTKGDRKISDKGVLRNRGK